MGWRPLVAAVSLALACAGGGGEFPRERVVDLTWPFDADTVYWPTEEEGFVLDRGPAGPTEAGTWYEANRLRAPEHGGTHLDAPVHFWEGGRSVDAIPVRQLVGPGAVVDVSRAVEEDPDYQVTVEDLLAWEERHGRLPTDAIVLLQTGWGRRWPDRKRVLGTEARGSEATAELHFPGLHPDAARWLATERRINAVGIDTPSIDHGPSRDFASHVALFSRGIPAFENVAHLEALPPRGFRVVALPMKIRGGSGAPLRIVALVPASL